MENSKISTVYICKYDEIKNVSRLHILHALLEKCNFKKHDLHDKYVAIKLHFGELGNLSYVNPQYIKIIVDYLKTLGAKPFLTDTNCLNGTYRLNAVDHIGTAYKNGFTNEIVDTPIIIADGLLGNSCVWIDKKYKNLSQFAIGKELISADYVIYVSHFKGHQIGGFGGALKNMGVGSAAKIGKMDIHYEFKPIIEDTCDLCNKCVDVCKYGAISKQHGKIDINTDSCTSCCDCMEYCDKKAISLYKISSWKKIQEKYVEYAAAVHSKKKGKLLFVNVLENIASICDCWGFSNNYFVSDIGIVVSEDPVAIDKCSYDLVNECEYITDKKIINRKEEDKFSALYPNIESCHQINYAKQIGLGNIEYNRINCSLEVNDEKSFIGSANSGF